MQLMVTVEIVEPGDPEYGEYKRKVITNFPPGLSDEDYAELRQTCPRWRLAHLVADVVAGDPELAGKQYRVRAHRPAEEQRGAALPAAAAP